MSLIQRLFGGGKIEQESKNWMLHCSHCGKEYSLWEAGGIRFGGAGTPTRFMKCPHCKKYGWSKMHRKK